MSKNKPLKSAYELAMERLQSRDREAGVEPVRPLTLAQKKRIAALRRDAEAKLAELEILHRNDLEAAAADPSKLPELEEKHGIDRRRVESRLESDIERVKRDS
jgi:hypothetical protein